MHTNLAKELLDASVDVSVRILELRNNALCLGRERHFERDGYRGCCRKGLVCADRSCFLNGRREGRPGKGRVVVDAGVAKEELENLQREVLFSG